MPSGSSDGGSTKRLSSIKSLLILGAPGSNSGAAAVDDSEGGERDQRLLRSPVSTTASAPSPGAISTTSSGVVGGIESGRAERREMLRREAEKMREELAKKERELAEYGL